MLRRLLGAIAASALLGPRLRPVVRRWLRRLAIWRRRQVGPGPGGVAVVFPATEPAPQGATVRHPAIAIPATTGAQRALLDRFLARQTERSLALDDADARPDCPFILVPGPDLDRLPATSLESLLLTLASEPLQLATAVLAPPGRLETADPTHATAPETTAATSLLRRPGPIADHRSPAVVGRLVHHIEALPATEPGPVDEPSAPLPPLPLPFRRSGPYLLIPDADAVATVETTVTAPRSVLAELPPLAAVDGRPTVAFLLPFLAVGGAERLLLDLLADLGRDTRCLIVTVEPHRGELGETVSRARALTDHVYTLGDWLPRAAVGGALLHLLRRHAASCLMSWNGTVAFYDLVPELRRSLPELRLVHQLFDRSDGFVARTTPELGWLIDAHVAANRNTAAALVARGVAAGRIHLVHHGVAPAPVLSAAERREQRRLARLALGLPADRLIVGTFARLHAQKRPLDWLALAARPALADLHFVWVGSGPFAGELQRAMAARSNHGENVTLAPFTHELEPWFAAIDLCLLPSSYEGLPVFLLEGLARCLPCVATAVGDVPLLLAEGGGYTAAVGDLAGLERGLLALADPVDREREGQRGSATVGRRFSRERFLADNRRILFGEAPA